MLSLLPALVRRGVLRADTALQTSAPHTRLCLLRSCVHSPAECQQPESEGTPGAGRSRGRVDAILGAVVDMVGSPLLYAVACGFVGLLSNTHTHDAV